MTSLHCRSFAIALAAAALAAGSSARAEDIYPVRFVVPCAAGTPADLIARKIAKDMFDVWGQYVRVENMPEMTGAQLRAAGRWLADGRTIVFHLDDCGVQTREPRSTSVR